MDYRQLFQDMFAPLPPDLGGAVIRDGDEIVELVMDRHDFRALMVKFLDGEITAASLGAQLEILAQNVRAQVSENPEEPTDE